MMMVVEEMAEAMNAIDPPMCSPLKYCSPPVKSATDPRIFPTSTKVG